ncbi:LuxR C-terminal-related transcriptional regulator [Eudoraea adriatica]|uniref:LuxR C-terminal-related transcriptional regulator n=1 Tax=Eudoraea adriatica TaxID=446681 RepID=UPI0003696D8F|nr:LuxR C-terminal-related transcriptional regulator [Eudoraea adriatica]
MFLTKLKRPILTPDLFPRPHLLEELEKKAYLPFLLVSAPAGYGKSVLISQWLEVSGGDYTWISLEESMNDTTTFLSYFTEAIKIVSPDEKQSLIRLQNEYKFLTWEIIIEKIVKITNKFQGNCRLILDDYHLIRNQQIHELVQALINENTGNLLVVIITRWDPPFTLRGLRLYQKMFEIRMRDLRFQEHELTDLLVRNSISLSADEIKELTVRTEGWILAIRMMIIAKSFTNLVDEKMGSEMLTTDLDELLDHISQNLDPNFIRQMQLCSLCDQFNADLIDSICTYAFKGACNADIFLAKLKDLNFFLIPIRDNETWYRFHHLFGDILKRHLEKSEPNIIIPLYLHISSWFSGKGIIDEAIRYAIKAKNYDLACDLISEHKTRILDQGQWWVVQRWLENIPEHMRRGNMEMLLTELAIAEETYSFNDVSYILGILESLDIENTEAKIYSQYLYHLGYYLTFLNPNPEKALEALERSKVLYKDESVLFGARRELLLAIVRQMLGKSALALGMLDDIDRSYKHASIMHLRSLHARIFVYMLSGEFSHALAASEKFHFITKQVKLNFFELNAYYLLGNSAFQILNIPKSQLAFKELLGYEGILNYRMFFDALAGVTILNALNDDNKTMESFLNVMNCMVLKMKNPMFQLYERSVRARVHLIKGQGNKELEWAQTDWVEQSSEKYAFLIDVPAFTKIRILVNYGSIYQVKEALNVLADVEAFLDNLHNRYHTIDIEFLKAMALFRLGDTASAKEFLEEALLLAEKSDSIRPVLEAYKVMPTIFNILDHSTSYRILTRINFVFANQKSPVKSLSDSNELSLREQELIGLVAKGFMNKEIAEQLNISTVTVKSHLTNIYRKLKVPNRTTMLRKVGERSALF